MKITFSGAARCVTGSCFLVETATDRILVDCGLAQGQDEKSVGTVFPFSPSSIDAVILTHAHIDHSGRLPQLVKEGFSGPIYSTGATHELASIMLLDSAHIQESDAEWKNRKGRRAGQALVEPLYTEEDAYDALSLFHDIDYGTIATLSSTLRFRFTDAGHLLGSASAELFVEENGKTKKIVFSGDIGNINQPIIKDPEYITSADYVVMESTYGTRVHETKPTDDLMTRAKLLAEITDRTFRRGGKLIIPSFAVGRTQEILYLFRLIIEHKLLDYEIPVFLDSPLSVKATAVFRRSIRGDYFDDEAMELVRKGINPVDFPSLIKTRDVQDSIALNSRRESCVIISSSGMCEAGRIKHHLKHNLWKKECTVLFVGYQAAGTLGRSIADGAKHVSVLGEEIDVRCEVTSLPGLSGHADKNGLLAWIDAFKVKPEKVYVVHGDEDSSTAFAAELRKRGYNAFAPMLLSTLDTEITGEEEEAEVRSQLAERAIEEAGSRLKKASEAMASILGRFTLALTSVDTADSRRAERLADAANRLAAELETLDAHWKADLKEKK